MCAVFQMRKNIVFKFKTGGWPCNRGGVVKFSHKKYAINVYLGLSKNMETLA